MQAMSGGHCAVLAGRPPDPGQQVIRPGTSSTPGHHAARATPLDVLLAAALQLVLDHHKRYKQPMPVLELEQRLNVLGVWPLAGRVKPLCVLLKQEAQLFTLQDGSVRYYYARKSTRVMSPKHRSVCNAAVQALLKHKASQHKAGQQKAGRQKGGHQKLKNGNHIMQLSNLQRILSKDRIIEGIQLDSVLREDPRFTIGRPGRNTRV